MIRRNRIAMGAVGGVAVALMLAGCGAQGSPEAQPSRAAADGAAPPVDVPLPGVDDGQQPQQPNQGQQPNQNQAPDQNQAGGGAAPTDSSVKLIAKDIPKMGRVVTDGEGWTLYRFDKDSNKPSKSNCNGACEKQWPVIASQGLPVLEGIDPSLVGTVIRADGKQQVTLGGWPLYRFGADPGPGKWKGQGVKGTWWVISPDGKRNLTCVPKGVKRPTDSGGASSSGGASDPGSSSGSSSGGYNY